MSKHEHNHQHEHNHEHEHNHQHEHNHEHSHGGKLSIITFFLGLALYIGAIFVKLPWLYTTMNVAAIVLSGYHIVFEGFWDTITHSIEKKRFMPNIHLLMSLAAVGAMIIGEYGEAALLILIFAGAHILEGYAEGKSKKEITNLLKLNPTKARLLKSDGNIEIVDVKELKIGDRLQVLNGDQIPTDGTILTGESVVDESSITGESIPVEKKSGDGVFGSTINGNGTFMMEITKDSKDTVFAKILELVSQTQSNISKTAVFIKKLEPIYVTIIFLLAPLFYILGIYLFKWEQADSFYRTMVFLIGASPCALAATDIPATLSAISNLAKRGVLFKGGSYLSNLADLKVVAFDKTGTLTEGKPVVTDVFVNQHINDNELKQYRNILVGMEKKSNHPLADAVLNYFKDVTAMDLVVENIIGVGLRAQVMGINYQIGKPTSYKEVSKDIKEATDVYEIDGKTVIYFGTEQTVLMVIAMQDIPKETSKEAIAYFKQAGIHTVMITGDAKQTGNAIGKKLQIDEVRGNVLPEQKAHIVSELKKTYGVTAMLGDGINDAPALVSADIGVAMGEGTDIAIDVADAVLMKNDLTKFAYTHQVSKKLRSLVWQNIIFSMLVVVFLITMNILGLMEMGFAVLIHEGSTLVVILNGLRLLKKVK